MARIIPTRPPIVLPVSFVVSGLGAINVGGSDYDFYISPTGTGTASGGGSLADPWPVSMLANATAQARYVGGSVGILDGTYNVHSQLIALGSNYDGAVYMIPSGSPGSPTIIAAVNPRQAIFTGKSGSTYGNDVGAPAIFGTGGGGWVTFDGLAVGGTNRYGIRAGIPYDDGKVRVPGITIKNCEFFDFDARNLAYKFPDLGVNIMCLELNQCTGALVQNNYFHDAIGWQLNSADHQSAIECWQTINSIFEYNTSINAGGFDGKAGGANGNTLRYNYMDCSHLTNFNGSFRAWGTEATVSSWGFAEDFFHNNICIGTTGINFQDYGGAVEYLQHPVSVYNNTIIVTGGGAASFGFLIRVVPGGLKFFNNIITSAASGDQAYAVVNVNANGLMDFNSYYRASGTESWQSYATHTDPAPGAVLFRDDASPLSLFRTRMGANSIGGANAEASSTSGVNPLFVGSGTLADFYQLQGGSTLKAGGANPGRSDGTSTGSLVDRGAWAGASRVGFSNSLRM